MTSYVLQQFHIKYSFGIRHCTLEVGILLLFLGSYPTAEIYVQKNDEVMAYFSYKMGKLIPSFLWLSPHFSVMFQAISRTKWFIL